MDTGTLKPLHNAVSVRIPGVGAYVIPRNGYSRHMVMPLLAWHVQRTRWAVAGLQRALIDGHYLQADPNALDGGFGPLTEAAAKQFQNSHDLVPDGVLGRKSCRKLFRPVCDFWEQQLGIPDHLMWGQTGHESGYDPGAEGSYDRDDRGLVQANRHWHPEIPDEEAFAQPSWCIMWSAGNMVRANLALGSWPLAVASHNSPVGALAWSRGEEPTQQLRDYVDAVYLAATEAP